MTQQPRILLLGEMFRDVYWLGEATSLSAEVPVPVVKIKEKLEFPGGAGNVAANLRELGASVIHITQDGLVPTYKHRLMVGNHQLARWDENDKVEPFPVDIITTKDRAFDAIVISDYNKGAITPEIVDWVSTNFGELPIFIDTKRSPNFYSIFSDRAIFFPNEKEFNEFPEYQKYICVHKMGSNGIRCRGLDGASRIYPALAKQVTCVNGCGDTVLAAWVYKTLTSKDIFVHPYSLLEFVSKAAAIAVSKPYTSTVNLEEINNFNA